MEMLLRFCALGQQFWFMDRFGEKLRCLRKRHQLTLIDLGNLLNVHNTFVSQIEKGRRIPNAEMILKVADIFGVTTDQLMRDNLELPEVAK